MLKITSDFFHQRLKFNPFSLTEVFDPWPLESLYFQHENSLPQTKVVCIGNQWVREREGREAPKCPCTRCFNAMA